MHSEWRLALDFKDRCFFCSSSTSKEEVFQQIRDQSMKQSDQVLKDKNQRILFFRPELFEDYNHSPHFYQCYLLLDCVHFNIFQEKILCKKVCGMPKDYPFHYSL